MTTESVNNPDPFTLPILTNTLPESPPRERLLVIIATIV